MKPTDRIRQDTAKSTPPPQSKNGGIALSDEKRRLHAAYDDLEKAVAMSNALSSLLHNQMDYQSEETGGGPCTCVVGVLFLTEITQEKLSAAHEAVRDAVNALVH